MTTTVNDFFSMPEADPHREHGRPVLVPKGLEGKGITAEYSRASGLADNIENKDHIHRWEMRYLTKAMGQNEDLAALAAVETYSTGVSDATFGREKSASGRRLDEIAQRALDRVRIHEKADRGTAVHGATEPTAPPLDRIPKRLHGPIEAFNEINRRECIIPVATEMFTANDITMSAGTFDHLVRVPGHPLLTNYVIADKKTGRFSPFEWCIQLSTYANGDPYDTSTDERPAWPGNINLQYGLVWQIGCEEDTADERRVKLWVVNLEIGWEMARIAATVRDTYHSNDLAVEYKSPTWEQRLHACDTADDLRHLWKSVDNDHPKAADWRAAIEEKVKSL